MNNLTFDDALQSFFQNNLTPGLCYPGTKGEAFTEAPNGGNLVYQDGTACSASYAFSDVYQMPDDTFVVQTKTASAQSQGDSPDNEITITTKCKDLCKVLVELSNFSGHLSNTTGDMLISITNSKFFYKMFKSNSMEKYINTLRETPSTWKVLKNQSFKYIKDEVDPNLEGGEGEEGEDEECEVASY